MLKAVLAVNLTQFTVIEKVTTEGLPGLYWLVAKFVRDYLD